MLRSSNFQRRKFDRLLDADDLSRGEVVRALEAVEGLREWILEEALISDPASTSLDPILARLGTSWMHRCVQRFFELADCALA